ncbi:MAG: hypothetical protein JOZ24_12090 [Candidatus Eremiobacteraeota bacterium]|nr:hypothetical protein [Candidatus Eremiobacteraeota bacterium]
MHDVLVQIAQLQDQAVTMMRDGRFADAALVLAFGLGIWVGRDRSSLAFVFFVLLLAMVGFSLSPAFV